MRPKTLKTDIINAILSEAAPRSMDPERLMIDMNYPRSERGLPRSSKVGRLRFGMTNALRPYTAKCWSRYSGVLEENIKGYAIKWGLTDKLMPKKRGEPVEPLELATPAHPSHHPLPPSHEYHPPALQCDGPSPVEHATAGV